MAITVDSRQARRSGRMPAVAAARARAFAAAKRHSWLVALLRVLCPLAAVGILAVYGVIVGTNWIKKGPIKFEDITIRAEDLTMKNPSYFDTTSDGRYEVRAKRAILSFDQSKKTPIKLIDVSGELTQNSGTVTRLKAKHGLFNNAKGELELFDGIEIDGSDGTSARLARAMIYSKVGKVVSVDPVTANMPTGSVQAGAMTMNTKIRRVQFTGGVHVRLVPQQGQTLGAGKDARQPVDVRAERLTVDDAGKTAHFHGNVVAVQGETTLRAPSLTVKYEGKAGPGASPRTVATTAADTTAKPASGGTRVTFLSARGGVEIVAGSDRRIVSDLVDFDVAADTALFDGNVVVTQKKNVLKGDRLTIDRKSGKSRLEPAGRGGRIVTTFHPPAEAGPRRKPRRQAETEVRNAIMGSFKADRSAPMTVEADLLELDNAASKAVFSGDVGARQGDLLLRTSELTAFFSGSTGLGLSAPGGQAKGAEKAEIVRLEARRSVIMTSKDRTATAKWADFDVKANTALLGGGVFMDSPVVGEDNPLKRHTVKGDRLRIDLTTGTYHVETDPARARTPPLPRRGPPTASRGSRPTAVIFPERKKKKTLNVLQKKALDALKKKAPGVNAP